MAYNILGVTPGHNGSACVLSDGELVYFLEEERLSKLKRDGNPFRIIHDIISRYKIDELIVAGVDNQSPPLIHTGEDLYHGILRKHYPNVKYSGATSDRHHLTHSFYSFYNSGFTKAISIVVDGLGSTNEYLPNGKKIKSAEIESIYIHEYPDKYALYNSTQFNYKLKNSISSNYYVFNNTIGIGKAYDSISQYLGFGEFEAGKTMGLSSYGKFNPNIPSFLKDKSIYEYFSKDDTQFSFIKENILDGYLPEDIAYKMQEESQQAVGDYIEKVLNDTDIKQVCCAGGYFLNCVANYYLTKRFPDIKFYFEPIANDAGTSIGAAKWAWHSHTQDKTIRPRKSLYHGPQYSKKQLLEGIQKYNN